MELSHFTSRFGHSPESKTAITPNLLKKKAKNESHQIYVYNIDIEYECSISYKFLIIFEPFTIFYYIFKL